jgi:hypothetical protein
MHRPYRFSDQFCNEGKKEKRGGLIFSFLKIEVATPS